MGGLIQGIQTLDIQIPFEYWGSAFRESLHPYIVTMYLDRQGYRVNQPLMIIWEMVGWGPYKPTYVQLSV